MSRFVSGGGGHIVFGGRVWRTNSGTVSWIPAIDHASIDSYEARLRTYSPNSLVGSLNIGKPAINAATGRVYHNLAFWFAGFAEDDYTISFAAISSGGVTDSDQSDVFSLPLSQ